MITNLNIQMPRRTPPQRRYDESLARFNLSIWGRQSGKSTAGYRKLLWKPLRGKERAIYWYILQTHNAAEVMFDRYMRMISPYKSQIMTYKNEGEKRIELVGGRNIFFKSGENFEDLRSETLNGCIIDEARQQNPLLWRSIIRPMLSRYGGWGDILTTPNGFDWCYDLYNTALLNPKEWGVVHAPSTEAWWWTPEEVESARATMSEAEFAQEIMAEFRDMTAGKAYVTFGQHNLRETNPFYSKGELHPMLPIIVGMDFNLSPMAWCLGQKKADQYYWFDEVWLKRSHTQEAAEVLAQKVIAYGHQKTGVILAGDATSKAGQRAAAGQSDYDIVCQTLDKHNIKWIQMTPESNPTVKDRVNTMNAKLMDGNGDVHCWFNPRCKETIRDFQRVVWKDTQGTMILDQTTDKERTHASDGPGYAISALSPLVYNKGSTIMRIIPNAY